MMLRQFLLASLLVVAFADHHEDGHDDDYHYVDDLLGCCSQEDRRDVQEMWKSIWSFVTDSKVEICRQMFGGMERRFPEVVGLLSHYNLEDMNSPELRAMFIRHVNGWDILINLLDDPTVFMKQIENVANQHAHIEGLKPEYFTETTDGFTQVMSQFIPCFDLDPWNRCLSMMYRMIADKLP